MRMSHLKVGSAADIPINISETDLSLLTATVVPPSGREEPCLLKRLRNGHVGKRLKVGKHFWEGGRARCGKVEAGEIRGISHWLHSKLKPSLPLGWGKEGGYGFTHTLLMALPCAQGFPSCPRRQGNIWYM